MSDYKPKYIKAFSEMAKCFGNTSEACRKKAGALIVKNGHIISQGVNGQPSGWPTEVCEDENNVTLPTVRHAEAAALEKLQRSTESSEGADIFITLSPCLDCAIKIKSSGIRRVYYSEDYRKSDGIEYLRASGVEVTKV